jgi:2-polyprenyl-6-hydroxyphenyl methylase/3-demethylubiquinone-9 3-methyltransferase
MSEPYYFKIKDTQKFLKHYLNIYKGDYNREKASKILTLLPELSGKHVLDVGCGGGFYSIAAHEHKCADITLVDLSPVCVKAARLNLQKNTGSRFEGVVADVTNLPFREDYFDLVLCLDVIEHVQDNVALDEISRVLREREHLILATQNSFSINYVLQGITQRYVFGDRKWMGWDPTHLRFYSPKSLHFLLRNHDFVTVEIAGTYFVPYLVMEWFNVISQSLSKAFYHILKLINNKLEVKHKTCWALFGWGIIFSCVKNKGNSSLRTNQ